MFMPSLHRLKSVTTSKQRETGRQTCADETTL